MSTIKITSQTPKLALLAVAALLTAPLAHAGNSGISSIMDAAKVLGGLNKSDAQLITESRRLAMEKDRRAAPPDHPLSQRLAQLSAGLEAVNGFQLNYKVIIDPTYNAFALPSGDVRVHSGLMELLSDDELVFVIGHEVGHVFLDHGKKRVKRGGLFKSLVAGAKLAGVGRETIGMGNLLAKTAGSAQSRSAEYEADKVGLALLQHTGRDLNAAVSCARKLALLNGTRDAIESFFSSHPDSLKRAEVMREMIPEDLRAPESAAPTGITLQPFGS